MYKYKEESGQVITNVQFSQQIEHCIVLRTLWHCFVDIPRGGLQRGLEIFDICLCLILQLRDDRDRERPDLTSSNLGREQTAVCLGALKVRAVRARPNSRWIASSTA